VPRVTDVTEEEYAALRELGFDEATHELAPAILAEAGRLAAEVLAPATARLAERLPGAAKRAAPDGLLDVPVREVRQENRCGQAEGEEGRAVEGDVEAGACDREDRPVPQVDAVGALPDPAQRAPSQEEAGPQARARVDDGHDRDGRGERDEREAAPVEERLELAEPEAEPDEPSERGQAE